jgi:DNA-binding MarR family transcriptional regulator
MEDADLVRREADEEDGRAVKVAATPKGAKAATAALPVVRAMNAAALEGFSDKEIAVISRFLTGLPERIQQTEKRRKP